MESPNNDRSAFAYVVSTEGHSITLNLKNVHHGLVSSHRLGVSPILQIGGLFGVNSGTEIIVLRTLSLSFSEPKEAHKWIVQNNSGGGEPLRNVLATSVGVLRRTKSLHFINDAFTLPPLGAEAFPLTEKEVCCIFGQDVASEDRVRLGESIRGYGPVDVDRKMLLSRHVAVLGSTGYGKSCFTAAALQEMLKLEAPRIVVFDINGEYKDALESHCGARFKHTVLGGSSPTMRIPFYALGRSGLSRLLLPSERTQRPALNFALNNLHCVKDCDDGVCLAYQDEPVLFDDCRPEGAREASEAIAALRNREVDAADEWPSMRALGCLIAESHSIQNNRNGPERNAFNYGNISQLLTRIWRKLEDPCFTSVIDTSGGMPLKAGTLDWESESRHLVDSIFGSDGDTWKVHVVELRHVAHDLMPVILGALLELYAFELFKRGAGGSYPTLLVLEEAHHYLRQTSEEGQDSSEALAYERLAKEGRKFGVSLWISTQRPSEVSPTVLAQCGTWATFRLTGQRDLNAVQSASEWIDKAELKSIAALPRQQAFVFGAAVATAVRVKAPTAYPLPRSHDPEYDKWKGEDQDRFETA